MGAEEVREDRLRRKLDRMGCKLMKSRARDPDALTYGGYQIVDVETGGLVGGHTAIGRGFGFDLDDVEAWIVDQAGARVSS